MNVKWLSERCTSTNFREIQLQKMASLNLSEENKQKLLDRERFQRWIDSNWKPFIAQMLPGDELWRFRSPSRTWRLKVGRAGYAIVRNGVIVHSLVTVLN